MDTEIQSNVQEKKIDAVNLVDKRIESTMKHEQKGAWTMFVMFAVLYGILISMFFQ